MASSQKPFLKFIRLESMTSEQRLVYVSITFRATVSHLSNIAFCNLYVYIRLVQPLRMFWKSDTSEQRLVTFGLRLSCVSCNSCFGIIRLDTFRVTVAWKQTAPYKPYKYLQDCGVSPKTLCSQAFCPSGPQQGSLWRLDTFEIRLYYVWEHPSNSWK
jgi:hypothetical protein